MSDTNVFKCKDTMTDGRSEGVVKVAQTMGESRDASLPGLRSNPALAVHNVERPRFGHGSGYGEK